MRAMLAGLLPLMFVVGSSGAQDIRTRADSLMRAAEQAGFSGVVRIARNGTTILEKGYGLANRAERIPFTPATVVQIGSNTKDFTIVALLQLHERGRLNVQDRISTYFPGAPPDKRAITVWQLVTHTAGFPDALGGDFEPVTRAQLIENAMRAGLLSAPGARESYSNTGYSLLAAIIEQVTGQAYDAYVHANILAPLGLTRTGFLIPSFHPRDLAHGYRPDGSDAGTMLAKPHAANGPYWNLRGNGGMLSTVGDMHAFYTALFETDKLLKPATRALRFDPTAEIGLAGSDNVNYFVYERDPAAGVEMIIASTNASMKAPPIRRALSRLLAFDGPPAAGGADSRGAQAAAGVPAPPAVAAMIRGFVDVLNRGDSTVLRAYLVTNVVTSPDAPPIDERVARLRTLHANLGVLQVVKMSALGDAVVNVLMKSAKEGDVMMRVDIEAGEPPRVRSFRFQVGGG